MMAPFYLAHLNLFILSDTLRCFLNLDRILLIGKILSSIQVFHWQLLFRHTQTFLQLRYTEYVMHVRQLRWQLQLVSYFASLLQNLERSNEFWCELASNLEMTQTSHR
jgi:hypothetical protein